ncbi:NUDIX domain-containing protein [Kitasatospora purpeofusca]|uniref:NUDIX domain-containing protein n=1 Tax=Kitasatospora purpeofusca TaxID=67352 RepID=UPI0036E640E2
MGDPHWRELRREPIHSAYGRGTGRVAFAVPDGREEVCHLGDEYSCATVVALPPDRHTVLAIDPGESPEDAAARELAEETGHRGEAEHVTADRHDA